MNPVLLLDTALPILAAAAAVVGIGSDTWDKNRHRLTKLGWIAVALIAATTFVGITRGVVSETEDAKKAREARAAQQAAEMHAAELDTKLSEVQAALTSANKELVQLGAANAQLSERVSQVPAETHGFIRKNDKGRRRDGSFKNYDGGREPLVYEVVVDSSGQALDVAGGETDDAH